MIFDTKIGEPALDGHLVKKCLKYYNELKSTKENIGWKLIRDIFPKSHKVEYSASDNRGIYNIKFLEP
jgi:hypothetical protein